MVQHSILYNVYFLYKLVPRAVITHIFPLEIIELKVLLHLTAYIFFIMSYLELILIHNIDYSLLLWKQKKKFVFYVSTIKENHIFNIPFSVIKNSCFPAHRKLSYTTEYMWVCFYLMLRLKYDYFIFLSYPRLFINILRAM